MSSIKERVDLISDTSNIKLEDTPTSAKIEICGKCTLNCQFCFQKIMKNNDLRQKIMSEEDFDCVLDFLNTIPTMKEVGLFYMGESALNNKLKSFMKKLKDNGYFTYLTTNGTILETVKESIPYIDSLKVSWNYKNLYDFKNKTGTGDISYNIIKHNISEFRRECNLLNKKLTVSTVLDSKKEDYEEILKEIDYDEHYWIPLQTQCGINENGYDGVIGEDDNKRNPIPCWSLFKCLYIDVDLNVRTCCYGHNDCHILYNIKDQSTFKLEEKLLNMRKHHLERTIPDECVSCLRGVS